MRGTYQSQSALKLLVAVSLPLGWILAGPRPRVRFSPHCNALPLAHPVCCPRAWGLQEWGTRGLICLHRGVRSLGSLYSLALWYLEGSLYSVFLGSIDFLYILFSSLTNCVINYHWIFGRWVAAASAGGAAMQGEGTGGGGWRRQGLMQVSSLCY